MNDAALPTQAPAPEPSLTAKTIDPLGVLRRNLKMQVYLGIAALFTVATAVSSLHHKSPTNKVDSNSPPAPMVQDASGTNIEEMRKEIAKQQDAVRLAGSADPSQASSQTTLPGQIPLQYGPTGIPLSGSTVSQSAQAQQLTPQQQQALVFDTHEKELAYKARFASNLAYSQSQNIRGTALTLSAGWGFFWRESSNDGLYGIAGNLIVPSNGVKSRYEGSRPIAQLDWQMTRPLSIHINYIYVFNASFEEQSVHATTSMSYISPWVTYRF